MSITRVVDLFEFIKAIWPITRDQCLFTLALNRSITGVFVTQMYFIYLPYALENSKEEMEEERGISYYFALTHNISIYICQPELTYLSIELLRAPTPTLAPIFF